MKPWQSVLAGFLGGIIATAVIFIVASQPRGTALPLPIQPTPAPIKVYVSGEVNQPGIYSLSPDDRVDDAIKMAGGFTVNAATDALNLAAPVKDGDKIYVPAPGSRQTGLLVDEKTADVSTTYPVNINSATLEELITLPGIGQTKASAIINYRAQNGSFVKIEDIQDVPGIGSSIYDQIKHLIIIR